MIILKWKLQQKMRQTISMPQGSQILTAQVQNGIICIWTLSQPEANIIPRNIAIYGTGWKDESVVGQYIGTVQLEGFVWHIFDQGE